MSLPAIDSLVTLNSRLVNLGIVEHCAKVSLGRGCSHCEYHSFDGFFIDIELYTANLGIVEHYSKVVGQIR